MFELDLEKATRENALGLLEFPRTKAKWRFAFAWLLLIPAGTLMTFNPTMNSGSLGGTLLLFVVCKVIGFLFLDAALHFVKSWRLCNQQVTAAMALAKDPRPPILYLRPFKVDKIKFSTLQSRAYTLKRFVGAVRFFTLLYEDPAMTPTGEELLVSLLDPLGPVVAIGKPGEVVPPIGAARLYAGNEWREVVRDYMRRSQLILLFGGTTTHFAWEIGELFRNEPFVPALMYLPFFRKYRQSEADKFVAIFNEASGLEMPKSLQSTRAVYFPERSKAIVLEDWNDSEEQLLNSLNPFLGATAEFMELTRPGWRSAYIESARENRRWSWIWIGVAAIYFAVQVALLVSFHQNPDGQDLAQQTPPTHATLAEADADTDAIGAVGVALLQEQAAVGTALRDAHQTRMSDQCLTFDFMRSKEVDFVDVKESTQAGCGAKKRGTRRTMHVVFVNSTREVLTVFPPD